MVKIRIEASSTVDSYLRYHGMAIDKDLASGFWINQPESIIGTSYSPFTYEKEFDLSNGKHTIIYGNSAETGYEWDAKIYVDGKLVASGKVSRYQYLKATFTVGAAAGIPWYYVALAGLVLLGAVAIYIRKRKKP